MILGAHVSAAGQASKAFQRARDIGAECLQIFTRAPSQWAANPLREVGAFRQAHHDFGSPPLFAHDIYLTNLAAADAQIRKRSIASQIQEMERCHQLGIQGLVCHMGSHLDCSLGLRRLSQAIGQVLAHSPADVQMLLETCAGQGNCLGHRFEHLAYCLERNPGVGVCLDTCHVLVAGYDLSSQEGYRLTWQHFDKLIGRQALKLLHLNDSQKPCGSRVDRHHHIGQGAVGLEPFGWLVNDPQMSHLPAIIETPEHETCHARNLALLKDLRNKTKTA